MNVKYIVKREYLNNDIFGIKPRAMSDEVKEFDTLKEALDYLKRFNSIVTYTDLLLSFKSKLDVLSITKLHFCDGENVDYETLDYYCEV